VFNLTSKITANLGELKKRKQKNKNYLKKEKKEWHTDENNCFTCVPVIVIY
jgi:hypothetical protein